MSFFKNIFGKKEEPIKSYNDFWDWFTKNERFFFKVVQTGNNIESNFLNKLSPKLEELKEGFFLLTGMFDDNTAELILTADGALKNIVFIEELVNAAPRVDGWKFTALKPESDIKNVSISMNGFNFNSDNIRFCAKNHVEYPDEIDIEIVYDGFVENEKALITNGVYIFLDNYLGELNFATTIDYIKVSGSTTSEEELIPIEKLKDYLIWREKEFVEKYEGVRYETEDDGYAGLETNTDEGYLLAVINTSLMDWDNKASHPWIAVMRLFFEGSASNGMPDDIMYKFLGDIEDELMDELKDFDGYLNIGRETGNNKREVYFACKDFRRVSKVLYETEMKYSGKLKISYEIYKDKYWMSFKRFEQN